jgi:hypothetical protein
MAYNTLPPNSTVLIKWQFKDVILEREAMKK